MKEKKPTNKSTQNASSGDRDIFHIVFGEPEIKVLQQAMELDEQLSGKIEIIKDDYAAGPVAGIFETEGYQQRWAWWKELLEYSPYNADELMNMVDDRLTVHQLKRALDENTTVDIWIWMGQNAHDVCGYYWLMTQLKDYQGRVKVLYLNNLPFINEKGSIFYPSYLHEIQPKEFLKAKKLARNITLSEFEVDPDEWSRLCSENTVVRILEGGKKIVSKEADYYDNDIIKNLTTEAQKGHRAINNILSKMKIKTGDVFLLGRMKQLAEEGKIELTGEPSKGWKEFDVKLKTEAPAEVMSDDK